MEVAAQTPTDLASELKEATVWAEAQKANIPLCVYNTIFLVNKLRTQLEQTRQKAANLLTLFRIELGVTAKSERGQLSADVCAPKTAKTDEERLQSLKARRAKLLVQVRRYEDRLGKARKKGQKNAKGSGSVTEVTQQSAPEVPELGFQKSAETLFSGNLAQGEEEKSRLVVSKVENFENPRGLHTVADDRTRYEYAVTTKTLHLQVETVTDPRTGKSVTASTDEIGPPNSQATWKAIANTVISVVGYAIPINRLASILKSSCAYFTSTRLCAHLKLAAELFHPVYICLGEQLPDSDLFFGDDTKGRVIEINKALKDGGELQEAPDGSLIAKVADVFGRVFNKKRGKGTKRSLNVSVVIGKTNAEDPRRENAIAASVSSALH